MPWQQVVARPPQQFTPMGYPCYNYRKVGHFTQVYRQLRQGTSPCTPAPVVNQQIPTGEEVLAGTFFLNECPIIILFDSGASHDFMSITCVKKAKLSLVASGVPYVISPRA
jgi:hypothetical protein